MTRYRIMLRIETGEVFRHEGSPEFSSSGEALDYIDKHRLEEQHPESNVYVEEVPSFDSYWGRWF